MEKKQERSFVVVILFLLVIIVLMLTDYEKLKKLNKSYEVLIETQDALIQMQESSINLCLEFTRGANK